MADAERRCPSCSRVFGPDVLFCPTDGMPLGSRGPVSSPGGTDPYLGLKLLGQIEIKKLAGVGSMARVYRAFQHGVERDVAVKILHRELSSNPEIVERFHREARVAGKVAHPNVVQVLLTAQMPADQPQLGGELVMVMEYLDGMSLLSALRASGSALTLPRALHVALQICDAVGDAHGLGVVHRDLKPENVMLVRRGDDPDFVKVLDFGLARLSTRDASYATRAGAIFGSPRYISPEGAQGLPVGPPADVYAIATVLYQCLAGRTPFEADSAVGYLLAHANEPPPRLSSHERASYVPDPIVDLLDQALAKRPEDRPADARQFGRDLLEAARRSGLSVESLGYGVRGPSALASLARTHSMPLGARADLGNPLSTGTIAGPDDAPAPHAASVPRVAAVPAAARSAARPPTLPPDEPAERPVRPPTLPPSLSEGEAELLALTSGSGISPTLFDEPLPSASALRDASSSSLRDASSSSLPEAPASSLVVESSAAPAAVSVPPANSLGPISIEARLTSPSTGAVTVPPMLPGASDVIVAHSAAVRPARRFGATAALVLACFGGGAALAFAGASRLGMVVRPGASPADGLLAEAAAAAQQQRWDETPPGQNVRELLERGAREFPADPRFVEAQKRASLEITLQAVGKRSEGNNDEALKLANLAQRLDPSNAMAQSIAKDLATPPSTPPSALPLPSFTSSRPRTPHGPSAGGNAPPHTGTPPAIRTGAPDEPPRADKGDKGGKGAPPGGWL